MRRMLKLWESDGMRLQRTAALLVVVGFLAATGSPGLAHASAASERQRSFTAAAAEFGVPQELLLSISYNQSRWEDHNGLPSADGGYGLMHLTTNTELIDGRGDHRRPRLVRQLHNRAYTLDDAARLLAVSPETVKKGQRHNVRGGAALVAHYAKESNNGQSPSDLGGWYSAVARLNNAQDDEAAQAFADDVYDTIQTGVSRTTTDGQRVALASRLVKPDRSKLQNLRLPKRARHQDQTECPRDLSCKFVPARFAQNNPTDPLDYGNLDRANRPRDIKIKYIMIHDTEGSYQSSIDWFRDPASFVSAHYIIRSSDGEVTQMVKNKDIGWHARNWYINMHSIGVEHEGFSAEGATWYTEAMYRSSAKLVRYLADKYDIPLDRDHIIGHDQNYPPASNRVATMHTDPGPFWDWERYMELLGAPVKQTAGPSAKVVAIAPKFVTNKPPITQCIEEVCTPLPSQSANVVYVRTQPSHNSPLVTNIALHPDGSPGTNRIEDWSATAVHGQRFAVAGRQGDWTAIWYGGQKGWIHNPSGHARTALPVAGKVVTPKEGLGSVPLYGRPLPEASAYTHNVPVQPVVPLQYQIPAGQTYPVQEKKIVNDYLHVLTFDRSSPGDGTLVVGSEKYIPISYNHRQGYVKASDVQLASD